MGILRIAFRRDGFEPNDRRAVSRAAASAGPARDLRGGASRSGQVAVLPSALQLDLPHQSTAPGLARRAIEAFLGDEFAPDVIDTVLVVSNELVSNAIRHTSGGCHLSLRLDDAEAVVEVRDDDVPTPERTDREGQLLGRGLGIVQSMTSRWGIERHPEGGKIVWAEIPTALSA